MKLQYACLEGPENGVYVRGRGRGGVIELPSYWVDLVNSDSLSVQITPIGYQQSVWFEKIENNFVYLSSDSPDLDYFYIVYGERKDVEKLKVEF